MRHPKRCEHYQLAWIPEVLRRSPTLRCITYVGGAATILQTVVRVYGPSVDFSVPAIHLRTIPFVASWTWAFISLRSEDIVRWRFSLHKQNVAHLAIGSVLGAGVFLAVVATAAAWDWVHFPSWGWQYVPKQEVIHAFLYLTAGHAAVAWNEETVFRGYGLDTAAAAFGRPAAITGLVTLFALAHGPGLQVFVGQSTLGLALTFLRLYAGSLWLPFGYHLGWNLIQTAIFGPPDGLPSIRPMEVHGPELWLGRPGHPVPGLLMITVNLVVALIAGVLWWRQKRIT